MTDEQREHVCEDCGAYAEYKRPCPYNEEMGGLYFEVWLCENCYGNRVEDI